jgi:hypothetical protein
VWIDDAPADYPDDWPLLPDPDLLSVHCNPKLTREIQQHLRAVRAERIAAWERVKRERAAAVAEQERADRARVAG